MDTILHIGLPKTATTYLQRWLSINADALKSKLVVIRSEAGGHRIAAAACETTRFRGRVDINFIKERFTWDDVKRTVSNAAEAGASRAVISSEYFFLPDPKIVRDVLKELGLEVVRIICLFRRQDRLVASGYAQDVKMLGRSEPLIVPGYIPAYDWGRVTNAWNASFPAADFVSHDFDYLRFQGSLLRVWKEALEISGVQTKDTIESERYVDNESLSAEMVEICRIANGTGISLTDFALRAQKAIPLDTPFRLSNKAVGGLASAYGVPNAAFVASVPNPVEFADYLEHAWKPDTGEDYTCNLPEAIWARVLGHSVFGGL